MTVVKRSLTINAPAKAVFDYLTDPFNEVEMNPRLKEIKNVTGKGEGQRWCWTYQIAGFQLKGEAEVAEYVRNNKYVTKTCGDVESKWSYHLKEVDGKTKLKLVLSYKIIIPIIGEILDALFSTESSHEVDAAIAYVKNKLERKAS